MDPVVLYLVAIFGCGACVGFLVGILMMLD